MTSIIIIIGGWDWRAQSLESVAQATSSMVSAMPDEPSGKWVTPRKEGDDYIYDSLDDASDISDIATRIERTTSDAVGGRRPKPGFDIKLYLLDNAEEYAVECRIRAGLEGPRGVRNHILVRLNFNTDDQLVVARAVKDHMAALVRAWHPDYLSAHTYEFRKAQGWDSTANQIPVGWDTYLSDRTPLAHQMLVGSPITQTRQDDGVYFTLSGTPQDPSIDQARLLRKALGYE
ncbi:immunity 52 family protein [Gordonia metallireducens]|uniref:immunity 52 family protein n=1 Tax=Gordonia metallireducens TaxID=2897779 RepID=UPI001E3953EA|nr:immunity 52 family protein [Gordonia metallireducens]